jgi:hypothetical protein
MTMTDPHAQSHHARVGGAAPSTTPPTYGTIVRVSEDGEGKEREGEGKGGNVSNSTDVVLNSSAC